MNHEQSTKEEGRMDVNLILFKKDGSQKAFPLPSNITVIGRRRGCDLRIPLSSVSRRHCQISCNKDSLEISDLGSRNGTYLNNKRIDDETTVRAGDYLKIGPLIFLLQIDGQPKEIVPPEHVKQKKPAPKKEIPAPKAAAKEDSFVDLEINESDKSDKSDSFLDVLKDL
jgi:pSer/pThr/pTyr-binding forkhead associated (FHA) protein